MELNLVFGFGWNLNVHGVKDEYCNKIEWLNLLVLWFMCWKLDGIMIGTWFDNLNENGCTVVMETKNCNKFDLMELMEDEQNFKVDM